jgi:hypothetical protein
VLIRIRGGSENGQTKSCLFLEKCRILTLVKGHKTY